MDELKRTRFNGAVPGVLVSGASFAGLATAWWLRKLGYAVTIVEVAKALRTGGTPVDIREGVIEVVQRMGLLERIAAHALNPRPMRILGADGEPIVSMPDKPGEGSDVRGGYEIERNVLLQMMFDEVRADVEVLFDDSIAGLEETADEVRVSFMKSAPRAFELVIGCDGTHSVVRKLCFGPESAYSVFMQNYFSLTIVDKSLLPEDTAQMWNVPGLTVMLSAYNRKTDIAFCYFSEEEIPYDRRNPGEQKALIRRHFAGQGWRIGELLEEMDAGADFYFDKLCQIRMDRWSTGRVALVGDAAYCPSPAAGMGGSMAILGAAALADALARHPADHKQAFAEYDRSFRPVAEQIQSDAIEFGMAMVMPRTSDDIERRNEMLRAGQFG